MNNVVGINGSTVGAESLKEAALAELRKEASDKAKVDIKGKLKQIEAAKLVLSNLERELEVLIKKVDAELNP